MKRILGSLAIGIFPSAAVIAAIITLKIIAPGTRAGFSLFWFFIWPVHILHWLFPSMETGEAVVLALPIGLFLNIAIVSLLAYLAMRTIRR